MTNRTMPNYITGGAYPFPIRYNTECSLNEHITSYPEDGSVKWRAIPASPGNLKHLYTGEPWYYPSIKQLVPVGTLYDHDFSYNTTHKTGMGKNKIIGAGHYKVWPMTNQHIYETREYTEGYFKKPGHVSDAYKHDFSTTSPQLRTNWS